MLNYVVLQGRITQDVEKKTMASGISVADFTIACSNKYKETEKTCFQRCKAWRSTADYLEKYFKAKGTEVIVEGTLETERWTNSNGENRKENVLHVDRVHFCGKKQAAQESAPVAAPENTEPIPVGDTDELPF